MGVKSLAKKHGIKALSQLGRWINLYEEFGVVGLCPDLAVSLL